MKKLVLLLLILAAVSFASTTATPSLSISVSNISRTITPGASFAVEIKVQNNGQGTATDVFVEPDIRKPFAIKTGTEEAIDLGSIGLGQIGTAKVHIQVLPGTPSDVYDLDFAVRYKSGTKDFALIRKVSVNVEASPVLEITEAEYGTINPGDHAPLSLTIRNIGSGQARNIRAIYANATGAILPAGSAVAYISTLSPGKSETADIPLSIAGDAEAGAYSVGIQVSYEDEDGILQPTLSRIIGLRIDSDIELKAYYDSGRVVQNMPSNVVVSIANIGPNTAQYLEVVPVSAPSLKVTPGSIYIGNLESDDFDTAEFEVVSENAGAQDLVLTLMYKDQFNQEHEITRTVGITTLTPKQAAAYEQRSYAPLFLLLVLAGAGIWYWRRRKKKA